MKKKAWIQLKQFLTDKITLFGGDSRDVLKECPDNSIDSVLTDPPYALVSIVKRFGKPGSAPAKGNEAYQRASAGFMGKQWDTGEVAFDPEFWAECLRVLKPGGHLLSFGGTRTYHRMACAIEDAGFEIRDMMQWLYGSGFPKSHDVSKGIDKAAGAVREWEGWGTALKPANEPITLARKPLSEKTVAANVLKWGTGAINIDGCRIKKDKYDRHEYGVNGDEISTAGGKIAFGDRNRIEYTPSNLGRFPANVITDGSDEVVAAFPETKARGNINPTNKLADSGNRTVYGAFGGQQNIDMGAGDAGSAARFFYQAKANKRDRAGSKHPTVKPINLLRYLARLITPPGGIILDPFAGSGTTGEAAYMEGFKAILIERETEYQDDIAKRLRDLDNVFDRTEDEVDN